jgi:hypothetical protein
MFREQLKAGVEFAADVVDRRPRAGRDGFHRRARCWYEPHNGSSEIACAA